MLKMIWKGCPMCRRTVGFLGEKEFEELEALVLVFRATRRHTKKWAMLVPRRGTEFPWIAKRSAKLIDQLWHNRVILRCDNETAIEALAKDFAQARQEGSQTVPEKPPVGGSRSNGITERTEGLVARPEH